MDQICYHHFTLNFDKNDIKQRLGNIRLILVAGCWRRALKQAEFLAERLTSIDGKKIELEQLTHEPTRFKLFKVGHVLISDHGMGAASMSIAIHELLLMCREADILDRIHIIRFGTCGGLGIEAGNLCITDRAVDPLFNDYIELKIVGKIVKRPCVLDKKSIELIQRLLFDEPNHEEFGEYQIITGATMAANDFYEEQGRTNGAICDHTPEDKKNFLARAKEFGVVNVEMESNHLAAMCHKVGVKFAIICLTLTNRLTTDTVNLDSETMNKYEKRLFWMNFLLARHLQSQK